MKMAEYYAQAKQRGMSEQEADALVDKFYSAGGAFDDDEQETTGETKGGMPASSEEKGLGSKILGGIGKAMEVVDRFTGAPIRTGLVEAQKGLAESGEKHGLMPSFDDVKALGKGALAGIKQFGREGGATGSDITANMGVEGKTGKVLGAAYDIALDPTNFIPSTALAKGIVGGRKLLGMGAKTAEPLVSGLGKLGGFAENTIKGTASHMSGANREVLEEVASKSGALDAAKEAAKTGQQRLTGGRDVNDITKYSTGEGLENATEMAEEASRNRFKGVEDLYLGDTGAGAKNFPNRSEIERLRKEMTPLKQGEKTLPKDIRDKNFELSSKALGIEKEIGSFNNLAEKNINSVINRAAKRDYGYITPAELGKLDEAKSFVAQAKTGDDLLKARRDIDEMVKAFSRESQGAGFAKLSAGDKALMDIRNGLNDALENHIKKSIDDPTASQYYADMFRANNKLAAEEMGLLKNVKKEFGLAGKEEDVFNKATKASLETLSAAKQAAEKTPEMGKLFKEISDTVYDSMILKAINKDGKISPEKFKGLWSGLEEKKVLLFGEEKVRQIDKLLESMRHAEGLGITKSGQRGVTLARTGLGATGAIGGASIGGAEGGFSGAISGMLLGTLMGSPATALAIFKATNKTKEAAKVLGKGASSLGSKLGKRIDNPLGHRLGYIGAKELMKDEE